jgi:hypothetical protein
MPRFAVLWGSLGLFTEAAKGLTPGRSWLLSGLSRGLWAGGVYYLVSRLVLALSCVPYRDGLLPCLPPAKWAGQERHSRTQLRRWSNHLWPYQFARLCVQ